MPWQPSQEHAQPAPDRRQLRSRGKAWISAAGAPSAGDEARHCEVQAGQRLPMLGVNLPAWSHGFQSGTQISVRRAGLIETGSARNHRSALASTCPGHARWHALPPATSIVDPDRYGMPTGPASGGKIYPPNGNSFWSICCVPSPSVSDRRPIPKRRGERPSAAGINYGMLWTIRSELISTPQKYPSISAAYASYKNRGGRPYLSKSISTTDELSVLRRSAGRTVGSECPESGRMWERGHPHESDRVILQRSRVSRARSVAATDPWSTVRISTTNKTH